MLLVPSNAITPRYDDFVRIRGTTWPLLMIGICRIALSCIGLVSRRPVDTAGLSGSRLAAGTRPGRAGYRSQGYPRRGNPRMSLGSRLILHIWRCT